MMLGTTNIKFKKEKYREMKIKEAVGISVAKLQSTWQREQEHDTGNIKICYAAAYLHFSGDEAHMHLRTD